MAGFNSPRDTFISSAFSFSCNFVCLVVTSVVFELFAFFVAVNLSSASENPYPSVFIRGSSLLLFLVACFACSAIPAVVFEFFEFFVVNSALFSFFYAVHAVDAGRFRQHRRILPAC
jgi:hypothetical protein